MKEIFKDINGYEGLYQISNLGKVKSLHRIRKGKGGSNCPVRERICKTKLQNGGYEQATLIKNSEPKTLYVHRLVAEAFIPNPHSKAQVNHIDGNKLNNNSDNLEWVNQSENELHARNKGLKRRDCFGDKRYVLGKPKLNITTANEIRSMKSLSTNELAEKYNVSRHTIKKIINNERWKV